MEDSIAANILNESGVYLADVREKIERGETSTQSIDLDTPPPQDLDEDIMIFKNGRYTVFFKPGMPRTYS